MYVALKCLRDATHEYKFNGKDKWPHSFRCWYKGAATSGVCMRNNDAESFEATNSVTYVMSRKYGVGSLFPMELVSVYLGHHSYLLNSFYSIQVSTNSSYRSIWHGVTLFECSLHLPISTLL